MYRNMKFYTPFFFLAFNFTASVCFIAVKLFGSVLSCAKEAPKFTARFSKTVCIFISFKEVALADI